MTASLDELRTRVVASRGRSKIPALGAAIVSAGDAEMPAWVTGERVRGEERGGGDRRSLAHRLVRQGHHGCAVRPTGGARGRRVGCDAPRAVPRRRRDRPVVERDTRIDQVLTHRAGLPANLERSEVEGCVRGRPAGSRSSEPRPSLGRSRNPATKPGSFRYSNLSYIVAGAAIERIVGRSWEEAVVDDVLAPLGITSVGFGAPTGDQPWGHGSRWRGIGRGGRIDPGPPERPNLRADNPPVMGPAGRIHLTLRDWGRFVRIFLTDGAPAAERCIDRAAHDAARRCGPEAGDRMGHPAREARAGRRHRAAGVQHHVGGDAPWSTPRGSARRSWSATTDGGGCWPSPVTSRSGLLAAEGGAGGGVGR